MPHEIAETVPAEQHAADVDGDGDQDILAVCLEEKSIRISWLENTDGRGKFGPERPIVAGVTPF